MEGWQQDLMKTLETVAEGVEQFFQEVGKEMGEAADAWLDFTEEVAEEIERVITPFEAAISPELDRLSQSDWVEPLLQAVLGFESTLDRAAEPFTHTVEPLINQHPVCVGCRNYHGQVYNGSMLVCAMHPYGMVDGSDQCPDKELFSWSFPSANRSDSFDDQDF
jgi:hypothetical protein